MRFLLRRLALWQEGSKKPIPPGGINESGTNSWEEPRQEQEHEFRRYVYEALGYPTQRNRSAREEIFFSSLPLRKGAAGFMRHFPLWAGETRKGIPLGLINENGRPAWEDISREEGHEFRRFVYETLRYRK